MLTAGKLRYIGPATGRHQDGTRSVSLVIHRHKVRPSYRCPAIKKVGAAVINKAVIDAIEALDLGSFIVAQSRPVQCWCLGYSPAKACTGIK